MDDPIKSRPSFRQSSDHTPAAPRRFSLFPHPLAKTIAQVTKPVFKKHGFAEHRILTEWHLIVGQELAGYSLPQKLSSRRGQEGATLHVLVASARALELQHMLPVILDRIATYFGYRAVTRLAFTQTASPLFLRKTPERASKLPVRDSVYAGLAEGCEDEFLRKALQSLGEAIACREDGRS